MDWIRGIKKEGKSELSSRILVWAPGRPTGQFIKIGKGSCVLLLRAGSGEPWRHLEGNAEWAVGGSEAVSEVDIQFNESPTCRL